MLLRPPRALASAGSAGAAPYLYAWANHADSRNGGFLAVVDADPQSSTYGKVIGKLNTGDEGGAAHHTEYEMPEGTTLFANDWGANRTYVIDLTEPAKPTIRARFRDAGEFSFPHSFARLPNGNVLATFQSIGPKYAPPGGLVELDNQGTAVRSARSETLDIPNAINWPYSLAIAPAADRVITTSTDMGRGPEWKSPDTNHVQLWSLKDLKLLASVPLPPAPSGKVHVFPAEPRVLADGSVYVNTFTCGLYRLEEITSAKPEARFVHAFPTGPEPHDMCAVPLVYGKYWIQTVGAINGLVVLDISNPTQPKEVSRLALPHRFHAPHWLAADRSTGRIAATGMYDGWLAMLNFDEASGTLTLDESFGDKGGLDFDDSKPGNPAKGVVHGILFSR